MTEEFRKAYIEWLRNYIKIINQNRENDLKI
jgi:hypothetical protein